MYFSSALVISLTSYFPSALKLFLSSFVSNFVCLLMQNWQLRCIKLYPQKFSCSHFRISLLVVQKYICIFVFVFVNLYFQKFSYFPTCCKELYQEAKSSRWAHTRSSRRHIQQGSISACSRSTSERKGKEGENIMNFTVQKVRANGMGMGWDLLWAWCRF